eukprot:TRINITY_DN21341_c0_g1_i2.p1 TRINITY_DN21341_c0_g1~~TRINITY_DN21341_c0_g1_i2.p1  ORF type:complete len:192 (-),score=42.52 TRINITY_DN21341_c0_g1_i2:65-640(-)
MWAAGLLRWAVCSACLASAQALASAAKLGEAVSADPAAVDIQVSSAKPAIASGSSSSHAVPAAPASAEEGLPYEALVSFLQKPSVPSIRHGHGTASGSSWKQVWQVLKMSPGQILAAACRKLTAASPVDRPAIGSRELRSAKNTVLARVCQGPSTPHEFLLVIAVLMTLHMLAQRHMPMVTPGSLKLAKKL